MGLLLFTSSTPRLSIGTFLGTAAGKLTTRFVGLAKIVPLLRIVVTRLLVISHEGELNKAGVTHNLRRRTG
ncbi:MAG: hypothetical protein Kow0069_22850 [Promethearchaeota archaeon]